MMGKPFYLHLDTNKNLMIVDFVSSLVFIYDTIKMELVRKSCISIDNIENINYADGRPFSISLCDNFMAINTDRKNSVYIISLDSKDNEAGKMQKINVPWYQSVNSVCLSQDGSLIYMHLNENTADKLVAYSTKNGQLSFESLINQDICLRGSWQMRLVTHNSIAMCLWGQQIVLFFSDSDR
jgi:hypothetical protein